MLFRENRADFEESKNTLIEVGNRQGLIDHCRKLLKPLRIKFDPIDLDIKITDVMPDERLGWPQTCTVTIEGYGVVGFTDLRC